MLTGELAPVNAAKVVSACEGLDQGACAAVEAALADRLVGMDPARITTVARRVATRIAPEQVAAAAARNKRDRAVQVSPGPDGTTDWWARIPAAKSAAAWAAVRDLADTYTSEDPDLTLDQARADAFIDLLLTNVTVTAKITLGIPVLTGPDAARREHAARRPARRCNTRQPTAPRSRGSTTTASATAAASATGAAGEEGTAGTATARLGLARPPPPAGRAWVRGSACPRP